MTQRPAWSWFLGSALIWAAATAWLATHGGDWVFPLFALGVFGLAGTGLMLLLTRGAVPAPLPVARPRVELLAVLGWLLVYALVFLGPVMDWAKTALPDGGPHDLLVAGIKLIFHVLLPALLLRALGAPLPPLLGGVAPRHFWRVLLVLGGALIGLVALVSPSLKDIAATRPDALTLAWAIPFNFVFISLVAGLNEEFLFRGLLQTRLAAVIGTGAGAVPVAALLFGLAHWPGLYWRGGPGVDGWSPDPIMVAAFTLATLAPLGMMLGFTYWRTRSLLLVTLLHGAIDFLPSLAEFIRHWR